MHFDQFIHVLTNFKVNLDEYNSMNSTIVSATQGLTLSLWSPELIILCILYLLLNVPLVSQLRFSLSLSLFFVHLYTLYYFCSWKKMCLFDYHG